MTLLKIKLNPGSHSNRIWGWEGDRLKVSVTAKAKDDEANESLIKLLSVEFRIPKTSMSVTYGKKGRLKTIKIWNLSEESVEKRIDRVCPRKKDKTRDEKKEKDNEEETE